MANWFETRRKANAEARKRNGTCWSEEQGKAIPYDRGVRVFLWKHTKRKKPYFVGTHIEWLNAI